jgi:hydrogenase maturation factor
MSVSEERAQDLVKALKARGVEVTALVGEVIAEPKERIIVE